MEIQGSVAIVTGGASGLGAATAKALISQGGRVVLVDMAQEAGEKMSAELGDAAIFCKTDVTSEKDAQNAVDQARKAFGGLNILVNCAGIGIAGKTVGKEGPMPLSQFATVIQVNLVGSFNMARLAAAVMVKNQPNAGGERGVIINTASIAAWEGQIGQVAYSASKGGVVGMTLPMARDLARDGVRVLTIAPGIMQTPMLAGLPEKVQESLGAQVPFPSRLGQPAEYADIVTTLVRNAYMNGSVIRVDGALRMSPK